MNRERTVQVTLIIIGLLFVPGIYPMILMKDDEAFQMLMSLYVPMGVFLLLAARKPGEHRSLISYAGWANVAHAGVMIVQSFYDLHERMHLLIGSAAFGLIGLVLIVITPGKPRSAESSAVAQGVAAH